MWQRSKTLVLVLGLILSHQPLPAPPGTATKRDF